MLHMQRQNIIKTQDRHVWILFSALVLCMAILWSIPGLQPADARPAWRYPKPFMPGFPPPPDFAGRPLFASPRPGFFPERHAGFPPPKAGFVEYREINVSSIPKTQPADVTIPLAKVDGVFIESSLLEPDKPLWCGELAQTPSLQSPAKMLRLPSSEKRHLPPERLVPPSDGLWLRAGLFMPGQAGESFLKKQSIQDSDDLSIIQTIDNRQNYSERQRTLAQSFYFPADRLQFLQVLRL